MRKIIPTVLATLFALSQVFAQSPTSPDLQSHSIDFFNPAHKEVKEEVYKFRVEYRVEAGYVQNHHRSEKATYENVFMHGFRTGATCDFILPLRFSIQTGLLYTFTYGKAQQRWAPMTVEDYTTPNPTTGLVYTNIIGHRLYEHQLTIPVRAHYNIHLWKDLNMFFYTGPQFQIGVALRDELQPSLSPKTQEWLEAAGVATRPYDRYADKELHRFTAQWGVGGGMEWDRYRLQAGYDFGLNNQVRHKRTSDQQMWEWHWFVSFCYRLNK